MNTNVSRLYRRRIGEILVNQGILSTEQLDEALAIQKKTGDLLGVILQDLGLVSEPDIAKTICIQYQLPFVTLANYEFDARLVKLFPLEFLTANKILPFDKIGDTLLLLVAEIPPDKVLAEIPKLTKLNAALYVGYASEVDKYLTGTGPKPAAQKPAAAAQAAAPPEERVLIQRVVDDDGDEDAATEDDAATGAGKTLAFGADAKSFLEELDSTWDQIFPGGPQEDAEKSDD
jgi:hypothetical protein